MGPGTPYAIAARFAYPDRPVIAFVGDGAFQMNGMNEMITIKRYIDRLGGPPPFIFCVFNNQDLNQVTWEQRAMAGDPKFPGSQVIPDVPYARYAQLLGLRGIYCDKPGEVGAAWEEALASDVPVVLEFKTDPEIAPIPPHIMKDQAKKAAKAALVVSYGGSLSGEHGDGQQRAELLERQYGPELLEAMREFKRIWDPQWKMNPGKVIDPYRLDEDLRIGTGYNPPRSRTKFAFIEEKGDFAHATLRCVGIGKCRVPEGSPTMCPSYQVTREEKHSTRGRARLLFEMLQGEVITDGWQSREVHDALDLCLACKGCTSDCPVNVDMPTYKSEFLYHHFRSLRRWRPRYAYVFGFIDKSARLASLVPELANFMTQTPGLRWAAQQVAGVDKKRPLPRPAPPRRSPGH